MPGEDPKPIFDFYISGFSTNRYKVFENEKKKKINFFISIEKYVQFTSNKLDISYYRGIASNIIQNNADKANHDTFVSFIHQLTSR